LDKDLGDILNLVYNSIPDPKSGLPFEVFKFISSTTPMVNVDLLIKDCHGSTLLTWREDEYYGPSWHIPGGIIRYKETAENRIIKVAQSELSAEVRFESRPLEIKEMITDKRDFRGHFISILYLCKIISTLNPENEYRGGKLRHGDWKWHKKAPANLIKPHYVFKDFINDTSLKIIN